MWDYFGLKVPIDDNQDATENQESNLQLKDERCCKLCFDKGDIQTYKSTTSSTALKKHLSNIHDVVVNSAAMKEKVENLQIAVIDKSDMRKHKEMLAHQIALLCVKDFRSLNVSKNEGFIGFCIYAGVISKGEKLPDPETIKTAVFNISFGLEAGKLFVLLLFAGFIVIRLQQSGSSKSIFNPTFI